MNLSNAELLLRLDAAFKGITEVSTLGESILQPEKMARFIQNMEHRSTILPEARYMGMDAQQVDIDRLGIVGRILKSGAAANGSVRVLGEADAVTPTTYTNKLIAQELQAIVMLRDHTLRRNIERGGFEDTLIGMFGEACGRDFEEWGLFADKLVPYGTDDIKSKTDGWLRKATNKLFGRNVAGQKARDFDATANGWIDTMFNEMLAALPKQYLQNPTEWRLWCPWDVFDGYRDILRARNTNLGDSAQTGTSDLYFKGIPVRYAPMLERSAAVNTGDDAAVKANLIDGRVCMLGNPDNMVWGVFHQVTIEPDRMPKDRRTDFVLTFEGDVNYEDENAVVVSMIDKANPAAA